MLEPGRMSWNWLRSSFCHSARNSFEGYKPPAATDQVSASRSACCASRFNRFVRDWLVYVPRCNSKYSSPTEVARPFASVEAASSVTPAEQVQRPERAVAVLEVADALFNFLGPEAAVVGVGGWKVGEDARPVDPLPYKGVVGGLVGVVPGKLLGEKEIAARLGHELR